jgi:hypothetical protein
MAHVVWQDLITYRVGDVGPIQLYEAVVGTGKHLAPNVLVEISRRLT